MSGSPGAPGAFARARARLRPGLGPLLLVLCAAALVFWLTASPDGPPRGVAEGPARPRAGSVASAPLEGPALEGVEPAGAPAPATHPGPAPSPAADVTGAEAVVGPEPLPTLPGAGASVRVRLVGIPAEWLVDNDNCVYALPGGRAGTDEDWQVPRVGVAPGTQELEFHLPATGRYDLGFACAYGHVLTRDVLVPAPGPVELALLRVAPVKVRAVGPGAEGVRVSVGPPEGVAARSLPGRGERRGVHVGLELDAAGVASTPPLEVGPPWRIQVHHPRVRGQAPEPPRVRFRPERDLVRAGEEVLLHPEALERVEFPLRFREDPSASWIARLKTPLWAAARVRPAGRGAEADEYLSTFLRPDGTFAHETLVLGLAAGDYEVEVGVGLAFDSRRMPFTVAPGARNRVELEFRPLPDFDPSGRGTPESGDLRTDLVLRVSGLQSGEVQLGIERASQGSAPPAWGTATVRVGDLEAGPPRLEDSQERYRRLWACAPPYLASGTVLLPERGEVDLALLPAGIFVLVPDVVPDRSLGRLMLRAPDGRLLPTLDLDDGVPGNVREWYREVSVAPGVVLGPFPAGEHRFQVYLGGVRLADAIGTARAGRLTPLAIRVGR